MIKPDRGQCKMFVKGVFFVIQIKYNKEHYNSILTLDIKCFLLFRQKYNKEP